MYRIKKTKTKQKWPDRFTTMQIEVQTLYMFKKGVKNIALNTVCGNSDSPPCERSLYFS